MRCSHVILKIKGITAIIVNTVEHSFPANALRRVQPLVTNKKLAKHMSQKRSKGSSRHKTSVIQLMEVTVT